MLCKLSNPLQALMRIWTALIVLFFLGWKWNETKDSLVPIELNLSPQNNGGSGFKKTSTMNQALLAKMGWRIHCGDPGLWAKTCGEKYTLSWIALWKKKKGHAHPLGKVYYMELIYLRNEWYGGLEKGILSNSGKIGGFPTSLSSNLMAS